MEIESLRLDLHLKRKQKKTTRAAPTFSSEKKEKKKKKKKTQGRRCSKKERKKKKPREEGVRRRKEKKKKKNQMRDLGSPRSELGRGATWVTVLRRDLGRGRATQVVSRSRRDRSLCRRPGSGAAWVLS